MQYIALFRNKLAQVTPIFTLIIVSVNTMWDHVCVLFLSREYGNNLDLDLKIKRILAF